MGNIRKNALSDLRIIMWILLSWWSITMITQVIICPKITEIELLLRSYKGFILDFKTCPNENDR